MFNRFFIALGAIVLCVILLEWATIALQSFSLPRALQSPSGKALSEINFDFFSSKIKNGYISQGYGSTLFALVNYAKPRHNGIDLVAVSAAPLYSATAGTVIYVGNQDNYCYKRGYGKFVLVKNKNDGKILLYAHLQKIKVAVGNAVKRNDLIGLVGQTGFATAPHLHLSVFEASPFKMGTENGCGPNPEGKDINPIPYLESLE